MKNNNYSPLYFLASLGNGGLAVSFFMYLMFMTNHKDTPIPTFSSLSKYFLNGNQNILFQALIIFSILGITYFTFIHLKTLFWNLKKFKKFKKTKDFEILKNSNKEVSLMTIPLTLAMSINVLFIIGAVFVPGLWNFVEYLFPFALLSFGLVGVLALKIFTDYLSRVLTKKSFDFEKNNSLSQMIAPFALAMIGVGFGASAAMSHNKITVILGLIFSIFFITIVIFFSIIKIILGFKSMLRQGISLEESPSFWVLIPILTLVGISFVRQNHGLHTSFSDGSGISNFFILTTIIFSIQIIFGYIGYKIMKKNKYFEKYLYGKEKSAGSYSLICPGVAIFVFGHFFIHLGLVKTGILEKFSIMYFLLIFVLLFIQLKTIYVLKKLNKKMM